ncbi:hypothetical protein TD95_005096 [Thielaviopsis punctulata]|uniref:Phytocyanin domain-containing protein n=1 Tax=Thielaviopsis punctulata TaxID=72032 RepID=A0A0F4Z7P0_9PEZI|nr:hypothetical protein TD95_005096 [Thielaviopsis punctulata]
MQFRSALVAALASSVMAKDSTATMTSSSMSMSTGSSSSSSSSGTMTFAVRVGMDASGKTVTKFSPENIKAPVGSVVQFQFMAANHTVTQSDFDSPCIPISDSTNATGFYSGFVPAAAALAKGEIPVYSITINDTKPIWVFCSQAKHCQSGMSMVINENTAANASRSLANYQAAAKSVAKSEFPEGDKAVGGTSGLASTSGSGLASETSGSASSTGSSGASTGTGVATAGAAPLTAKFAAPGLLALLAAML